MDFNMSVRLSPIPAEEPALYVGRVSKTAFEVR